ncbi:MAG: hypothetical protein OXQ94_17005 [Gemmatimonadota bacterium]|nr:hypothetical protein [Gemmatimonadota bacterium]MDE2873379.1 hypothetical protein [Gemmatimonadota bacterium]
MKDGRGSGPVIGASPDEIASLVTLHAERYSSWSVAAFHREYRDRHGGKRSYSWVRRHLQAAGLALKGVRRVGRRPSREQPLIEGVLLRQEAIRSDWVPNGTWDLVVTLDEATNRVYSGFFVDEHDLWAGFCGVRETVLSKGFVAMIGATWVPDCRSSPRPTQFGRAMAELGVDVVPTFPKWGRSDRNRTLAVMRNCLPRQLRQAGVGERRHANRFLNRYWPKFNGAFSAAAEGERFEPVLPDMRAAMDGVLCLKERLQVDVDNCVAYVGRELQLPARGKPYRRGREVEIREFEDGSMEVWCGRRPLGRYSADGCLVQCYDPDEERNL